MTATNPLYRYAAPPPGTDSHLHHLALAAAGGDVRVAHAVLEAVEQEIAEQAADRILRRAEAVTEWGTRLTWADGRVEDRWCYRDQADAEAQVRYFAELIPAALPGGSLYGTTATLISRVHLTLPAQTVEQVAG